MTTVSSIHSLSDAANSWYDYLTSPPGTVNGPSINTAGTQSTATSGAFASDMPSSQSYVMIAILDNGSTAKLGSARYYPMKKVYRLDTGEIEIAESSRTSDGASFVTDSGRYKMLTPIEYTALKAKEDKEFFENANLDVSLSSLSLAAPKDSVPKAPPQAPTAPIGCGAASEKATIIGIGPCNVAASERETRPLANLARANNNVVTYVCFGVATEMDAIAALKLPKPRVLLAGANELLSLRTREDTRSEKRKYLAEAKLFAIIKGSKHDVQSNGEGGTWVLPSKHMPMEGKMFTTLVALASAQPPDPNMSIVDKCNLLNTQFNAWYINFNGSMDSLSDSDQALFECYDTFSREASAAQPSSCPPIPKRILDTMDIGYWNAQIALMGPTSDRSFATVDRCIQWSGSDGDEWPSLRAAWASTQGCRRDNDKIHSDQLSWVVSSYCYNTIQALRTPELRFDSRASLKKDMDDVRIIFDTLLNCTLLGGLTPWSTKECVMNMKGVLGPITLAGRNHNEPMRLVRWSFGSVEGTADKKGDLLTLLPETYIQSTMSTYAMHDDSIPMVAAAGVVMLAEYDVIPMALPNFTMAEIDDERKSYGARIYYRDPQMASDIGDATLNTGGNANALHTGRFGLHDASSYRTQLVAEVEESEGTEDRGKADRLDRTTHFSNGSNNDGQVYTNCNSHDTLCGMRVCWIEIEGEPVMSADVGVGGLQTDYEFKPSPPPR